MRRGKIEQVGSYWDVYNRPANMFVASFVGTPPMNFLPARIHMDGISVEGVPEPLAKPGDRYLPNLSVMLGIRPEDIQLAGHDSSAISILAETVEYLPSERCYFVYSTIGDRNITAKIKTEATIRRGERVPVRFILEHASYFDPKTGERVA
jgi:multiple sugar transport system ATP-binding protein